MVMQRWEPRAFLDLVARIGANPAEREDDRVRRVIWATTLACAVPLLLAIALAYASLGSPLAASIALVGATFFAGQGLLFGVRRRGLTRSPWPVEWG